MTRKVCKLCGITALTDQQLDRIFGTKLVNNKRYSQSDCKRCRKGK